MILHGNINTINIVFVGDCYTFLHHHHYIIAA